MNVSRAFGLPGGMVRGCHGVWCVVVWCWYESDLALIFVFL